MKIIVVIAALIALVHSEQLQCGRIDPEGIPQEWRDSTPGCVKSMRNQIQEELKAAMQYLAMGAHFSRDIINRPGFAKLFFEAASEERGHAIKLIHYLLMRGELTSSVSKLINTYSKPANDSWTSGLDALKGALKLEATVTKKIRNVIAVCENDKEVVENNNDYHLVDYLTGEFLEEQYKGQRDLAGKVSTLAKFMDKHGALGEFLYDKKLLNGEIQ